MPRQDASFVRSSGRCKVATAYRNVRRTSCLSFSYNRPMPQFISGLELSHRFFSDAVLPIISVAAPGLRYAAGLIGSGSEVLGFDDEMSSDHHWGPRVMIFLNETDRTDAINSALREKLPPTFLGYPTNFSDPDPNDNNVQRLVEG